jgi:hypothetical protein
MSGSFLVTRGLQNALLGASPVVPPNTIATARSFAR